MFSRIGCRGSQHLVSECFLFHHFAFFTFSHRQKSFQLKLLCKSKERIKILLKTFAAPQYKKSTIAARSSDFTPLKYIKGVVCLCFIRMLSNTGLEIARTTLCTSICLPSSQTKVTSVKSLSSFRLPNAFMAFSLKSFHCKHSFSDIFLWSNLFEWRYQDCLIDDDDLRRMANVNGHASNVL